MAHDMLTQYLLSSDNISSEDKKYTLNFCKKIEYICNLNAILMSSVNEVIQSGFGNVNSNICIVFDNRQLYEQHKQAIQDNIFVPFNIAAWKVYITFVDKCKSEYSKKYDLLINELYAVRPIILYIITDDINIYNNILQTYKKLNYTLPDKYFHIGLQDCISSDTTTKLWQPLHYIINYTS